MAYTPPDRAAVAFSFDTAYVEPARSAVAFGFVQEGPQGRASAASPLGAPEALALAVPAAWSAVASPLGAPAVVTSDASILSNASAGSPLGAAAALGLHVIGARSSAGSPLGAPAIEADFVPLGLACAASPLGAVLVEARQPPVALASAASPLGAAAAHAAHRFAQVAVASPLGALATLAFHDFTDMLPPGWPTFYVCDVVYGSTRLRVPVSSWQATMQTVSACYVQAVIPAAGQYATPLTAARADGGAEIVISRVARLSDGAEVESELARAAFGDLRLDRGGTNYSATISGYGAAVAGAPSDAFTRTLDAVRSISSGTNDRRARAAIDWFMRPGQAAVLPDATELTASWVNYYVNANDAYMDVGERA